MKKKFMRNPNGYGSVHKLSGNRRKPWRVRLTTGFNEQGKQQFINVGYAETRADAMQMLAKYHDNPWNTELNSLTFAKLYELWFKSEEATMKPASVLIYKKAYSRTEPIHKMTFKDVKIPHMQKIIDGMTVGHTMKKNVKTLCNKMYVYAIKNDLTEKNYASFLNVPKDAAPLNPHVFFTDQELKELWLKEGEHYEVAKMLLFTGMRINELLGMETKNVHLDKGYMVGGLKTTAGKERVIPISKHIEAIVRKWYDPTKKLLIQKRGMSYQNSNKFWKQNIIGHTSHDARHTFISLINRAEVNDVSIERIVGHSSQGVTKAVYTHKSTDDLIAAMNKFDDFCSKTLCI